jgi:molybdopterin synthase sulfur carrier subunit
MAKIQFSSALQKITGQKIVTVTSSTLEDAINELEVTYPGIKKKIVSDTNEILKYVVIFLGNEEVKYLQGLKTQIQPSDKISILMAIAGG